MKAFLVSLGDLAYLLLGLVLGIALAATVARSRSRAAQPSTPAGGTAVAPGALASADLHASIRDLCERLQGPFEKLSQPLAALQLPEFNAALALMSRPEIATAELVDYVTGENWVASCIAAEALSKREDSGQFAQKVIAQISGFYAWPMAFVLRYLDARHDGPVPGVAMVQAQEWWAQNAAMRNALTAVAQARVTRGAEVAFGDSLQQIDDVDAVHSLLSMLDGDLFDAMRREFRAWRSSRVDEKFLRSVGRFMTAKDHAQWYPDTPRLSAHLAQMRDARHSSPCRSILIVGNTGVGRRFLVMRFASAMAADGWRNYRTSAAGLIAGKKYIGEIEHQIRLLCENASVAKRVALYLPRFHEFDSAGRYTGRNEGLVDQLLPAIENGDILAIGTTTSTAYERLRKRHPTLPVTMDVIRIEPAHDEETQAIAEQFLQASGDGCDATDITSVAGEAVQLARQFISTPSAPGSTLEVLALALKERADSGAQAHALTRNHLLPGLTRLTGLPAAVIDETQSLDVRTLTEKFERQVIGQDEAVKCLVERIAMLKAGLTDSDRPIGVFLFAGPTGTGKTQLAKALAHILFGDEQRLVRLDMSEFQRSESIDKIVGTGRTDLADRSLIGRIREQPFSVVLLDEFEKAHNRAWDLFLQVFDDGRLADALGNVADFRHTIIILTSNLGATISDGRTPGFISTGGAFSASDVMRSVQQSFRKEFINRLDRVVVFNPLSRSVMRKILDKELRNALKRRGFRNREWAVEWDDTAVSFLLEKGFTLDMGARPLRRAIERYFLAPLSLTIVEHRFPEGDQFMFLRSDGNSLQVSFVDPDEDAAPLPPADGVDDQSLARVVLAPANTEAERQFLSQRFARLCEALESPEWETRKAGILAQINDAQFWQDETRYRVLGRYEFLDRVESALGTIRRLHGRLQSSAGSRQLNAQLAHKMFLLETALEDLADDRPGHSLLRIEPGHADDAAANGRALELMRNMYLQWAKRRGMQHRVVSNDAPRRASFTLAVTGFGAFSLLAPEQGLHVFDFDDDGAKSNPARGHVSVRIAPQSERPAASASEFATMARQAFADAPAAPPSVVRRYSLCPSPLVRDKVRHWRTGRIDQVLDGNFDLVT